MQMPSLWAFSIYKSNILHSMETKNLGPFPYTTVQLKVKSQTLSNSRIEKALSSRYCGNATVILDTLILISLMMKMRSIEIRQLYPVSKLSNWQEAGPKDRSVQ